MFMAGKATTAPFLQVRVVAPRVLMMSAAAVFAAAVSSAPSSADTIDPFSTSAPPTQMGPLLHTSKNWAGYTAETDFNSPVSDTVTAVSGSWIVPSVTTPVNSAARTLDCVAWVGIDGFSNNTVEQVGTESGIANGVAYYDAWFEMYPGSMWTSFDLSPGDSVTASVQYGLPSNPNQFQLALTDNTSGRSFTIDQTNSSALRSSAEWIVEAPKFAGAIEPLPAFGSVTFTNASATIGSTTGAIDDPSWQVTEINMSNPATGDTMAPAALVTVGSGASASSSFGVYQTPEPSTLVMLATAAVGLGLRIFAVRQPLRN